MKNARLRDSLLSRSGGKEPEFDSHRADHDYQEDLHGSITLLHGPATREPSAKSISDRKHQTIFPVDLVIDDKY